MHSGGIGLCQKMNWAHSMWIAGALVALARGHYTMNEGHDLSKSSYHLCTVNETKLLSAVVIRTAPYIVQRHCGGWLPWRTCNVTLYKTTYGTERKEVTREVARCCRGFVRVGSYCALPLNRTREFTTKPGLCPTTDQGLPDQSQTCVWDIDCSGWQKCCQMSNGSRCVNPATFSHYVSNGGWSLNVTVIVKTNYYRMIALEKGLLNHTQLLHAMVSGALNSSDVSVQYLSSCPVDPYRTATSLIIGCNVTLSLDDTTASMHLLLRDIAEVSSVTVEDVDECAHPALRNCSPQAKCSNTVASYGCTCRHGYVDVLPQNAGASCEVDPPTTTDAHPCIYCPPERPCHPATPGPTPDGPAENHTRPADSALTASPQTSPATDTSSTPPEDSPACAPPRLTRLSSSNITGTSFCLYWSSTSPADQTSFRVVVLRKGSAVISREETNENTLNVTGLDPGVLYDVTVTPRACDAHGASLRVYVKTAAQTLVATARVTNMNFTEDFLNSSSRAYLHFSASFKEEIYQSLSPEVRELVRSGKVRIEITSLSQGSVVVNFTIVWAESYDKLNVSHVVLGSLFNSTKYSLDESSTRVSDFDECALGLNDCSQNATCNNTWGSYTCVCNDGFEDMDLDWPGRVCRAPVETTTLSATTMQAPDTSVVTAANSANSTTASNTATTTIATTAEPTATPSFTTPTPVASTTPSFTTPTPVASTTPSITTPTPVASTTPSITTPTPVASTTPSITTPIPVASTTRSFTTPTPVATATTSLATPTAVPTVYLPTDMTTISKALPAISVECRLTAILVTVAKEFLLTNKISELSLYLGRESNRADILNSTHVRLAAAWSDTNLLSNDTYYMARVTLFNSPASQTNDTASFTRTLQVPIICTYRKSVLTSAQFEDIGYNMIIDPIAVLGSFKVIMQLLNGTSPLPVNYTLSPDEDVVVKVTLNASGEEMKLVISSCWATPTLNPANTHSYVFLNSSCPLPHSYTAIISNGNASSSSLSVRIFSFVKLDVIYLHCQVQICVEMGSTTCVPDCGARKARLATNVVGRAVGSSGALFRLSEESPGEEIDMIHIVGFSILGISMSLMFLGGLICLFFYQRNRIGHYNFNIKPKQDNFTFHVFST